MAKTRDVMKIIDKMVGRDVELKQLIADTEVNSQIAQMVYDAARPLALRRKSWPIWWTRGSRRLHV
jgi:hypothetical protein